MGLIGNNNRFESRRYVKNSNRCLESNPVRPYRSQLTEQTNCRNSNYCNILTQVVFFFFLVRACG